MAEPPHLVATELDNTTSTREASDKIMPNLFSLPRELRDLIYEFACDDAEVKVFKSSTALIILTSRTNTGIVSTCRQLRAEAQCIYWQKSRFCPTSAEVCAQWLQNCVPPTFLRDIKTIHISTPGQSVLAARTALANGDQAVPQATSSSIAWIQSLAASEQDNFKRLVAGTPVVLSPGVPQFEVVDEKCGVVWKSDFRNHQLFSRALLQKYG